MARIGDSNNSFPELNTLYSMGKSILNTVTKEVGHLSRSITKCAANIFGSEKTNEDLEKIITMIDQLKNKFEIKELKHNLSMELIEQNKSSEKIPANSQSRELRAMIDKIKPRS